MYLFSFRMFTVSPSSQDKEIWRYLQSSIDHVLSIANHKNLKVGACAVWNFHHLISERSALPCTSLMEPLWRHGEVRRNLDADQISYCTWTVIMIYTNSLWVIFEVQGPMNLYFDRTTTDTTNSEFKHDRTKHIDYYFNIKRIVFHLQPLGLSKWWSY